MSKNINNKILPKLAFSILGLISVFQSLRAMLLGKMEMYHDAPHTGLISLERTMEKTDMGFYPFLTMLFVVGLLLFISCGYDAWRKKGRFSKWQSVLFFSTLATWGLLVLYMWYFLPK